MTITLTREEAQQVLDCLAFSNLKEADAAAKTLRTRLAQPEEKLLTQEQAIDVAQKLFDSAMLCSIPPSGTTWQNAALRLGEELSTVGPDGYYNMTARQWLDWAMKNVTPARLAQPEPKNKALTHEENKAHNQKILDEFYKENAALYEAGPWAGVDFDVKTAPPQRECKCKHCGGINVC